MSNNKKNKSMLADGHVSATQSQTKEQEGELMNQCVDEMIEI